MEVIPTILKKSKDLADGNRIFKFAASGLMANALLYVLYLGSTHAGMNPLFAMTLSFSLGTIVSWAMNRGWTFGDVEPDNWSAHRFFICYGAMYAVNWGGLYVLVVVFSWKHQFAQGLLVVVIASLNLVLLRLWVFPIRPDRQAT